MAIFYSKLGKFRRRRKSPAVSETDGKTEKFRVATVKANCSSSRGICINVFATNSNEQRNLGAEYGRREPKTSILCFKWKRSDTWRTKVAASGTAALWSDEETTVINKQPRKQCRLKRSRSKSLSGRDQNLSAILKRVIKF